MLDFIYVLVGQNLDITLWVIVLFVLLALVVLYMKAYE